MVSGMCRQVITRWLQLSIVTTKPSGDDATHVAQEMGTKGATLDPKVLREVQSDPQERLSSAGDCIRGILAATAVLFPAYLAATTKPRIYYTARRIY